MVVVDLIHQRDVMDKHWDNNSTFTWTSVCSSRRSLSLYVKLQIASRLSQHCFRAWQRPHTQALLGHKTTLLSDSQTSSRKCQQPSQHLSSATLPRRPTSATTTVLTSKCLANEVMKSPRKPSNSINAVSVFKPPFVAVVVAVVVVVVVVVVVRCCRPFAQRQKPASKFQTLHRLIQ